MAKEPIDEEAYLKTLDEINRRLEVLETAMNDRFERMKKVIIDYLTLGNQMAIGSLITALKQV